MLLSSGQAPVLKPTLAHHSEMTRGSNSQGMFKEISQPSNIKASEDRVSTQEKEDGANQQYDEQKLEAQATYFTQR